MPVKVKCPYCGHEQERHAPSTQGHKLVLCDSECGGCGEYYVMSWKTEIMVISYEIGSEGNRPQ